MNPFSLLEKAINEHGSAVILNERLALARDEHSVLQRKLFDTIELLEKATLRICDLESENGIIRIEVQNKTQDIDRLTEQVRQYQQEPDCRPPEQELLLQLVANNDGYDAASLARLTNQDELTARYHLDELEKGKLISREVTRDGLFWHMKHEGRGYLVKHRLVPQNQNRS